MVNYKEILSSSHFTFLVGEKRTPLTIHLAVVKTLSAPLYALMSNGLMKEFQSRVASLDDIDVDTFVGFSEHAYTGAYVTPARAIDTRSIGNCPPFNDRISKRARQDIPGMANVIKAYNNFRCISKRAWESLDEYIFMCLWESFKIRKFDSGLAKVTSQPDLLFHAKLYVFATEYIMEPLRQQRLATLHHDLCAHRLSTQNGLKLILDLLKFTYLNTGKTEPMGKSSGKSLLGDLVIHYAACKLPELSKHEGFCKLLNSDAEMSTDLVMEMLK